MAPESKEKGLNITRAVALAGKTICGLVGISTQAIRMQLLPAPRKGVTLGKPAWQIYDEYVKRPRSSYTDWSGSDRPPYWVNNHISRFPEGQK